MKERKNGEGKQEGRKSGRKGGRKEGNQEGRKNVRKGGRKGGRKEDEVWAVTGAECNRAVSTTTDNADGTRSTFDKRPFSKKQTCRAGYCALCTETQHITCRCHKTSMFTNRHTEGLVSDCFCDARTDYGMQKKPC